MKILKILLNRFRTLIKAFKSDYRFAFSDYLLYLTFAEYPGFPHRFPLIEVQSSDDVNFIKLNIRDNYYYWPSDASYQGLDWMYQEVFVPASRNFHAYEFNGVKIALGDFVVDAGACEGFFTKYALQRGARVLAIEPIGDLAKGLRASFSSMIDEGRVEVLPFALGEKSGLAKLHLDSSHLYESRISSVGSNVQVKALDDLIGDKRVQFIKMDVEGAEVGAIMGARKIIAEQKPQLAIAVYHELENAQLICSILRELRSDYHILHRGIYAWEGIPPRPFMVFAW